MNYKNIVFNKLELFQSLGMKKILVACSGGADSMALLHIAHEYSKNNDLEIRAVHVNHNIQKTSNKWASQVNGWCLDLGINNTVFSVDFNNHSNIESKARDKRQECFSDLVQTDEWILTGHHMNDQAENVLLALTRGGGHHALSGMSDVTKIKNYLSGKPLLGLTKKEIIVFCKEQNIDFISDPTNFESIQDRNFIRNEIIPLLETRWPNFVKSTSASAKNIEGVSDILSSDINADSDKIFFDNLAEPDNSTQEKLRIWLKKRFGKSAGNNITNNIFSLAKNNKGGAFDISDFKIGVWKNTVFDLTNNTLYKNPDFDFDSVLFKKDFEGKKITFRGINQPLKKLFKEFNIPPWDRKNVPFYFKNDIFISFGTHHNGDRND